MHNDDVPETGPPSLIPPLQQPPMPDPTLQVMLRDGCSMCATCLLKNSMNGAAPLPPPHTPAPAQNEVVYVFIDESNFSISAVSHAPPGETAKPILYDILLRNYILPKKKVAFPTGSKLFRNIRRPNLRDLGHVCLVHSDPAPPGGFFPGFFPDEFDAKVLSLDQYTRGDHGEVENDTGLGLRIFQRLLTPLPPGVTGVLALVTGDRDFLPVSDCLNGLNLQGRWKIEVYSWAGATATEFNQFPGILFQGKDDYLFLTSREGGEMILHFAPPIHTTCPQCHQPAVLARLACGHTACYECLVDASMRCPDCCPRKLDPPPSKERVYAFIDDSNFWLSACGRAAAQKGWERPVATFSSSSPSDLGIRLSLPGVDEYIHNMPQDGSISERTYEECHIFYSCLSSKEGSRFEKAIPANWEPHRFLREKSEKEVSNSVVRAICERLAQPLPLGVRGVIVLFAGKGDYAPLLKDFREKQDRGRFPNWRIQVICIAEMVSPPSALPPAPPATATVTATVTATDDTNTDTVPSTTQVLDLNDDEAPDAPDEEVSSPIAVDTAMIVASSTHPPISEIEVLDDNGEPEGPLFFSSLFCVSPELAVAVDKAVTRPCNAQDANNAEEDELPSDGSDDGCPLSGMIIFFRERLFYRESKALICGVADALKTTVSGYWPRLGFGIEQRNILFLSHPQRPAFKVVLDDLSGHFIQSGIECTKISLKLSEERFVLFFPQVQPLSALPKKMFGHQVFVTFHLEDPSREVVVSTQLVRPCWTVSNLKERVSLPYIEGGLKVIDWTKEMGKEIFSFSEDNKEARDYLLEQLKYMGQEATPGVLLWGATIKPENEWLTGGPLGTLFTQETIDTSAEVETVLHECGLASEWFGSPRAWMANGVGRNGEAFDIGQKGNALISVRSFAPPTALDPPPAVPTPSPAAMAPSPAAMAPSPAAMAPSPAASTPPPAAMAPSPAAMASLFFPGMGTWIATPNGRCLQIPLIWRGPVDGPPPVPARPCFHRPADLCCWCVEIPLFPDPQYRPPPPGPLPPVPLPPFIPGESSVMPTPSGHCLQIPLFWQWGGPSPPPAMPWYFFNQCWYVVIPLFTEVNWPPMPPELGVPSHSLRDDCTATTSSPPPTQPHPSTSMPADPPRPVVPQTPVQVRTPTPGAPTAVGNSVPVPATGTIAGKPTAKATASSRGQDSSQAQPVRSVLNAKAAAPVSTVSVGTQPGAPTPNGPTLNGMTATTAPNTKRQPGAPTPNGPTLNGMTATTAPNTKREPGAPTPRSPARVPAGKPAAANAAPHSHTGVS
ncbi:hypothetical protein PAPYR_10035 [Paratrimastix pyriformis]|uniref:RING-type domain-containing protein n=1 Tax=Paratrimastix pyriformis TaxID=342808 RepID=A0ABQ8UCI1_9EUKA|nr:hypothetical protein PAPYR_10035 [Paratrimastix pyriformis]